MAIADSAGDAELETPPMLQKATASTSLRMMRC